jgi:hypothetical protein
VPAPGVALAFKLDGASNTEVFHAPFSVSSRIRARKIPGEISKLLDCIWRDASIDLWQRGIPQRMQRCKPTKF